MCIRIDNVRGCRKLWTEWPRTALDSGEFVWRNRWAANAHTQAVYKWIIVPKTLHSNYFEIHMLLRRSWILQRNTSVLLCHVNGILVRVILWERISMHAVVTEDWHLLSKKGIKNRENDESVSIPLYVFEVIKCVTYHACQVLHSIWCPCPLRRGVWEGNWWVFFGGNGIGGVCKHR